MSIENWIDAISALFEVSDGKGGQVRSYRVYEKNEFPEAITDAPVALTYTEGVEAKIMAEGGHSLWWGVTEFHLTNSVDKSTYPEIMLYFERIRAVMALNLKLGGLVSHFKPRPNFRPNIRGPVVLTYGNEDPHLGIVVYWEVKENETDTVSA